MAAARFELARQRGDLRLEPCRRLARLRIAPGCLGEALVRQRQRQVVRDPLGEVHVVVDEAGRFAREKEQRAEDVVAERHRHAERGARAQAAEDPTTHRARGDLRFDVGHHVGVTLQLRQVVASQRHRRPECGVVDLRARHRVDAERRAVFAPGGQRQDVVGQAAAHDLGHFREHVPDVERFGHFVQQAAQALDPLAAQLLALDDRVVLEGEAEQIDDAVDESLIRVAEGVLAARRDPQRPVHASALPHRAQDPRPRAGVDRVDGHAFVDDTVAGDLQLSGRSRDIQDERLGAIEPQDVQAFEGNRFTQRHRQTRHDVAQTWRLSDKACNGGKYGSWIGAHDSDRPV